MQLLPYLHLPQVPLPGCHGQVPELRKLMTNKNILFQIFSRKKPVHQPPSFLSSKLCRKLTRLSITNNWTLSRLPVASGVPTASPPSSLLAKSVAYGLQQASVLKLSSCWITYFMLSIDVSVQSCAALFAFL